MSFKTDLHIHSTYSDGTLSPQEIVEKYAKERYDMIAITDHEVTGGIQEAAEKGKDKNLRVIPGVEIATVSGGRELHILGYYFDAENRELKDKLEQLAEARKERNAKLLSALQQMGYSLDWDDLVQCEGQQYVGKPHFARALVQKGHINSVAEAFEKGKFLESDRAKEAERNKPDTAEIIGIISRAGGMAVLAHPCKIKGLGPRESEEYRQNFDLLLRELKAMGLKGLECIYPSHSDEERLFFIDRAAKYHLHITEGSDFHGDR